MSNLSGVAAFGSLFAEMKSPLSPQKQVNSLLIISAFALAS
jgi:hypothetical protein